MNRSTLAFIIIAGIGVLIVTLFFTLNLSGDKPKEETISDEVAVMAFDPQVENVLVRQTNLLLPLLSEAAVLRTLKAANARSAQLSMEDILKLDQQWSEGDGTLAQSISENEASKKLIAFQEEHPGLSEIFITDAFGLNAAQTNKTSDYYQADEQWWRQTFNNGAGLLHHGLIEFDESAQAEAISLYIPVQAADSNDIIGIIKAVLSIAAIKIEL